MGNAGRFSTTCLAIIAAFWTCGAIADPPRIAGDTLARAESMDRPATIPAEGPLDPAHDRYSRLDATMAANGVVPSIAYAPAPRWVTILGDVRNAGSYGLESTTMSLGKLLAECGGPDAITDHTVHVVRDGQPAGRLTAADAPLQAGDLVIVQGLDPRPPTDSVILGLVGLADEPIAVRVPGEIATIEGILERTRQRHLSPADVSVIVDGARNVPMDGTARLPACTVLVFDPMTVRQDRLPELPTNRFAIGVNDDILLASEPPTASPIGDSALAPQQSSNAPPAGHVTITAMPPRPSSALSDLPRIEPLGPPPLDDVPSTEPPPRTADASNAVTIGPPELESHIVPFPREDFAAPVEDPRIAAAPDPPARNVEPVGLPAGEPGKQDLEIEESGGWDLWPIALLAMLLGGGTFFVIRKLRDEETRAALGRRFHEFASRLNRRRESREPIEAPIEDNWDLDEFSERETAEIAAPMAMRNVADDTRTSPAPEAGTMLTPADILAALAANRLTFREEPVELPRTLFVHGRSGARARRRVDAADGAVPVPHVHGAEVDGTRQSRRSDQQHDSNHRHRIDEPDDDRVFDPAEPVSGPTAARRFGTPFEQALAKLRESRSSGTGRTH